MNATHLLVLFHKDEEPSTCIVEMKKVTTKEQICPGTEVEVRASSKKYPATALLSPGKQMNIVMNIVFLHQHIC